MDAKPPLRSRKAPGRVKSQAAAIVCGHRTPAHARSVGSCAPPAPGRRRHLSPFRRAPGDIDGASPAPDRTDAGADPADRIGAAAAQGNGGPSARTPGAERPALATTRAADHRSGSQRARHPPRAASGLRRGAGLGGVCQFQSFGGQASGTCSVCRACSARADAGLRLGRGRRAHGSATAEFGGCGSCSRRGL